MHHNPKITVTALLGKEIIGHETIDMHGNRMHQVASLQDHVVREQLIAAGWTPPQPPQLTAHPDIVMAAEMVYRLRGLDSSDHPLEVSFPCEFAALGKALDFVRGGKRKGWTFIHENRLKVVTAKAPDGTEYEVPTHELGSVRAMKLFNTMADALTNPCAAHTTPMTAARRRALLDRLGARAEGLDGETWDQMVIDATEAAHGIQKPEQQGGAS